MEQITPECMRSSLDRRRFLVGASAALLQAMGAPANLYHTVRKFRRPLPIPPVLQPVRSDATTDYYEITQREASVEILPGIRTRIWGYNGLFPGPTIEARHGRATVVKHKNELRVPTVAHLHGGVTRPESDGFPIDTVAPGEARTHYYDNTGRPATLWYHDHSRTGTGRNLDMGLAGLYLLKEDSDIAELAARRIRCAAYAARSGIHDGRRVQLRSSGPPGR